MGPMSTIRATLLLVAKYGIAPVLLVVFVVWVLRSLDQRLDAATSATAKLSTQLADHQKSMDDAAAHQKVVDEIELQLLRGICAGVTRGNAQASVFCLASGR